MCIFASKSANCAYGPRPLRAGCLDNQVTASLQRCVLLLHRKPKGCSRSAIQGGDGFPGPTSSPLLVFVSLMLFGVFVVFGLSGCLKIPRLENIEEEDSQSADAGIPPVAPSGFSVGVNEVPEGPGVGSVCGASSPCRQGLRCGARGVCEAPGDRIAGASCVLSDECAPGLSAPSAVNVPPVGEVPSGRRVFSRPIAFQV